MALLWRAAGAGLEPRLGWERQVSHAGDESEGAEKERLVDIFMWRGRALFLKGKNFLRFSSLIFFSI